MKLLFMCVANSARSQIAEGLAKSIFGPEVQIQSAGSKPTEINPFAVQAMRELDIDISNNYSKSIDDLPHEFLNSIDYVITLCADEVCPTLNSNAKKVHWPLPDPALLIGSAEYRLQQFRVVRDEIKNRLEDLESKIR